MEKNLAVALAYFEHIFIPSAFYDGEHDIVRSINENPDLLFDVFSMVCKDADTENTFSKEEFSGETFRMDGEWFGTRIKFPKPDGPHCYELYLFHDKDMERKGVFALEAATSQEDGSAGKLISYLDPEGTPRNFGGWPADEENDFFAGALLLHKKITAGEL